MSRISKAGGDGEEITVEPGMNAVCAPLTTLVCESECTVIGVVVRV